MREVLTPMLGVRFGLTLPRGKGILSRSYPQVSPEQTPLKGLAEIARGTERNGKESRRYHIRYHAPDALVERWREEQETK